jgi:hypothetical protein
MTNTKLNIFHHFIDYRIPQVQWGITSLCQILGTPFTPWRLKFMFLFGEFAGWGMRFSWRSSCFVKWVYGPWTIRPRLYGTDLWTIRPRFADHTGHMFLRHLEYFNTQNTTILSMLCILWYYASVKKYIKKQVMKRLFSWLFQ